MHIAISVAVGLLVIYLFLHTRTSRSDGDLLLPPGYRRLMFFIMPTRTESTVYFDLEVDAEPLERWVAEARPEWGANITHAVVGAVARSLAHAPRMNRFISGRRLYQRRGTWVSFSMKRARRGAGFEDTADLATVKLQIPSHMDMATLCDKMNTDIRVNRSGEKTREDKEFALFNLLPRPLLDAAAKALRHIDHFGLLPPAFIEMDPLYASAYVANLGSLGMDPGFHHLYEYGNCPLFVVVGQVRERPGVVDGALQVVRTLPLRITYDERIDDGLNARHGLNRLRAVLSDPHTWLGQPGRDLPPLDNQAPEGAAPHA